MKKQKPKVLIIRTAGTNCDIETEYAFKKVGGSTERVHINQFINGTRSFTEFNIIAIPGGFSYGDDIASGKILANEIRFNLKDQLKDFIAKKGLIIGICNGFQILVKSGLLPDVKNEFNTIEASLSLNDSAKFEDRWVYLKTEQSHCVWTKNIAQVIYLPVAHAEGKFIPKDNSLLQKLKENNQVVFRYTLPCTKEPAYPWNPNGAIDNIAGICDTTGRIFGLMPHPERHIQYTQHPFWTRLKKRKEGDGLQIFRNAIEFTLAI